MPQYLRIIHKPTWELRAVNPLKAAAAVSCVNIDPETAAGQASRSRTKVSQFVMNVDVSDARQEGTTSLLTSCLSCRLYQHCAVGPETYVDVTVTSTELPTHHLACQQCNKACHRY